MLFTNRNTVGVYAADVTSKKGGCVNSTVSSGLIMWSESGRTFVASQKRYEEAGGKIPPSWFNNHDSIPHIWDDGFRRMLGA